MTKEEAITFLYSVAESLGFTDVEYYTCKDGKKMREAVKVLEQESILDKIRTEISDIYCGQYCEDPMTADEMREQVLDIIDKYSAEVDKKYEHSCCYWENNKCTLGMDHCPDDYSCDSFD